MYIKLSLESTSHLTGFVGGGGAVVALEVVMGTEVTD
jgi:hypothetical protein